MLQTLERPSTGIKSTYNPPNPKPLLPLDPPTEPTKTEETTAPSETEEPSEPSETEEAS
jgi:hypothetical protein